MAAVVVVVVVGAMVVVVAAGVNLGLCAVGAAHTTATSTIDMLTKVRRDYLSGKGGGAKHTRRPTGTESAKDTHSTIVSNHNRRSRTRTLPSSFRKLLFLVAPVHFLL